MAQTGLDYYNKLLGGSNRLTDDQSRAYANRYVDSQQGGAPIYDSKFASYGITADDYGKLDNMQKLSLDKQYATDTANYGSIEGLAGINNGGTTGSWFADNKDMISGVTGLGQLGLGIAGYSQGKKLMEKQIQGLDQNLAFARENQQNKRNISRAFGV